MQSENFDHARMNIFIYGSWVCFQLLFSWGMSISARHVRKDITMLDEISSNYTVNIKMLFCTWEKSKRLVVVVFLRG